MTIKDKLIEMQKEAYGQMEWSDTDLLPYDQRRDNTFGQYTSNIDLIALEPFLKNMAGSSAVTICDGRGVEASYLKLCGLKVTATDLCPDYLFNLVEKGMLDDCSEQNAEALIFSDEAFDVAFVKAGLHHLPRPFVGLYELLRVAKGKVFIFEGHDSVSLNFIRKFFLTTRDYEESGNYVFRFREREIEKICLGLNLPGYAIKRTFMPWHRAFEQIRKGGGLYNLAVILQKLINILPFQQENLFSCVIFKKPPSDTEIALLSKAGFRYRPLPANPYIDKDGSKTTK